MIISIAKEKCKHENIDLDVDILTSGKFCSIIKTLTDEIFFINELKTTCGGSAKLEVKQEKSKMIFMMKCSMEEIEEDKKIVKLMSSCEKYFLQLIGKNNCHFYNRKNEEFMEMIVECNEV
jgi:hypothetical protein